jgi:hypothetical protein
VHRQRRFLLWLTALATACAVLQGVTGDEHLVLYLTPLFLIAALLLSGHYVAEDRIVERWRGAPAPRPRRVAPAWQIPQATLLPSLLERSPVCRRGPPAPAPVPA